MAKRRDPAQKEYNPLDDARGRLPIDVDLVRDVISGPTSQLAPVLQQPPAPVVQALPAATAPVPDRIASPVQLEEPAVALKEPVLEKLTQYNKFLTTPAEKLELERLAARMSGALGVSVRSSHLIRACLIQLLHSEQQIIRGAERYGPVKRPSNTEAVALAEFDHAIAEILSAAFREAEPIKSTRP